jgi:hypothetical protein
MHNMHIPTYSVLKIEKSKVAYDEQTPLVLKQKKINNIGK